MMDGEARLREVEIDLASHLRECALKSEMVWDELRHQRRILWGILVGILTTLVAVVGVLMKAQLHL